MKKLFCISATLLMIAGCSGNQKTGEEVLIDIMPFDDAKGVEDAYEKCLVTEFAKNPGLEEKFYKHEVPVPKSCLKILRNGTAFGECFYRDSEHVSNSKYTYDEITARRQNCYKKHTEKTKK